jgi:hypothetical protein
MSKLLILLLIALPFCSIAQKSEGNTNSDFKKIDKSSLLQKSRGQKTAAWIFLGGGAALITTGFLVGESSNSFSDNKLESGAVLVVVGGASALASIPFFISSTKNRKRAALAMKYENLLLQPLMKKQYAALSLNYGL